MANIQQRTINCDTRTDISPCICLYSITGHVGPTLNLENVMRLIKCQTLEIVVYTLSLDLSYCQFFS